MSERAPSGLEAPGRRLWRSVVAAFDLEQHELTVLGAAARLADEIARLEGELKTAATLVSGSKDQERPNPLFSELRAHRQALVRLLSSLDLPAAEKGSVIARSAAGSRLARIRWTRGA